MNNYIMQIQSVINKFNLNLLWHHCIETSAFIKFNMRTNGTINSIMKYESEFQSVLGEKVWLESKNGFISICIPKSKPDNYPINKILESDFYRGCDGILKVALGETPDGGMVVGDIEKWINVLIGGVPGSGKSNLLNVIINCLIRQTNVRLVLFDLKGVELINYNNIPHLQKPVISNVSKAQDELISLISEMNRRYKKLEEANCKNIQKYRSKGYEMPYLIVIIDELAEIILNNKSCENQIVRLAQKGRACGIHLIIATQKPNANIVTSLIKGSMNTRISFHVASHYDSQVILDMSGAEKLNKHGDMILRDEDGIQRLQCCFISDEEIEDTLENYKVEIMENEFGEVKMEDEDIKYIEGDFIEVIDPLYSDHNELYNEALQFIRETRKCNKWALKRALHIGDTKVNEIMEKLFNEGIISHKKIGNDYQILKEGF